ncbi:MAG TPA: asparaginase [Bacillota bacterium]|nr:asparaginase [Bacillota bacterium]
MKRIKVISLGGTISALGKNRLDFKNYTSGKLTGEELIEAIPEIKDIAQVDIVQLDNISSTAINKNHWIQLREMVHTYLYEDNYDGIVITHGTSTLEETAYFLHLTVNSEKPVILTGAQRPFSAMSTDVHLNLLHAIVVAAHDESQGKGVLVVSNETISNARNVTKTDTYALEAFQSPELGFLGFITGDLKVMYYQEPVQRHTVTSAFKDVSLTNMKEVAILYSYAGATGDLIEYIAKSGNYAGIVMAGTGAGRFSPKEDEALKVAEEKGLFVVRSSRVSSGNVPHITHYSFLQAITADNLSPQKARILLMLALQKTKNIDEIQELFYTH